MKYLLMTIRLSMTRRRLVLMLLIASLLIAGLTAALLINNNGQNQADYYVKQLGQLKTEVQLIDTLNSSIYPERKLSNNIDRYQGTLINMADRCQKMSKQYKIIKKDQKLKDLFQKAETTDRLCQDLIKVTLYAHNQSRQTEAFMLFPADSLDNQATAGKQAAKLQEMLNSTSTALSKLNSDPIQDPALPEQLTLIQGLQKQTEEAGGDPAKLNRLAQTVQTRQEDFLNARTYFWNNTIRVQALVGSIKKLQKSFEQAQTKS